nr:reverse transcriptase domain-containing protein [Tanacetum cinerariifolium]
MPASLNGRGRPIAPIAIQATNFGLKNDMIQQVQNCCQFHCLSGDDANKHLDKFLHVTQSIKVNGVTDDVLRLYLFPHCLTHHATAWFDLLPRNSINTFKQMAKIFLGKYFPPSMVTKLRNEITNFRQRPDESLFEAWEHYKHSIDRCPNQNMLPVTQIDTFCNGLTLRHRDTINVAAGGTFMKRRPEKCYDLIENMTAHHNDWDISAQRSESSSSITSYFDTEIAALKVKMAKINKNLMRVLQVNQQVKAVTPNCETCGGPHSFTDCPATVDQTQNVYAAGANQVWNKLSLPDMSPTCMTLELADRLISHSVGVVEDVFVKVGTFHFLTDFVVVDFDADPRVPLILGRSFLKTERDLIDVFEGELTLRVGKEAITFNLDQTSRYPANYNDMTANRIDVIDMACEEYSDFLLEEVDAFLSLEDDPTSLEVDQSYVDTEGDIFLLEAFLNDDPSLPPLIQGNYLPQVRTELKICEAKIDKSSIDEPPEVELKDLPLHLEHNFWKAKGLIQLLWSYQKAIKQAGTLILALNSPCVTLDHDLSHRIFLELLGLAFSWVYGLVEVEERVYPVGKRNKEIM